MENPLPCVLLRDKLQGNIILFKLSLYITWSEKQLQKTYSMLSTWVLNSTEDMEVTFILSSLSSAVWQQNQKWLTIGSTQSLKSEQPFILAAFDR